MDTYLRMKNKEFIFTCLEQLHASGKLVDDHWDQLASNIWYLLPRKARNLIKLSVK